jgi:hypothetical protein
LSNFENVRISFTSSTNSTPVTLGTATIADNGTQTSVIIPINSVELKEYLRTGKDMTFSVFGKARRTTSHSLSGRLSATIYSE